MTGGGRECDLIARTSRLLAGEAAADRLAAQAESVFQVPFRFLEMVRAALIVPQGGPAPDEADVDLAYRAILQRRPESADSVAIHLGAHVAARGLVEGLLRSAEWRRRAPELCMRAFPQAARLWHPHIPKTAGTAFVDAAARDESWGYLLLNLLSPDASLQKVASAFRAPRGGGLLLTGHFALNTCWDLIGPFDEIVTFVRDPVARALSMFQFARDVVDGAPGVHAGSADDLFARGLVYDSFERSYRNGFLSRNEQCRTLGREATCRAVLQRAALGPVEIATTDDIDAQVARRFPGIAPRRINVSRNAREPLALDPAMIARIRSDNAEDDALFASVNGRSAGGEAALPRSAAL